jgi:hypothetical protein
MLLSHRQLHKENDMKKLLAAALIAMVGIAASTSASAQYVRSYRYHSYGYHYGYGYHRSWVGPAIAGAIIGGAVASTINPPVVYAQPPVVYAQPPVYVAPQPVYVQPAPNYYRGY